MSDRKYRKLFIQKELPCINDMGDGDFWVRMCDYGKLELFVCDKGHNYLTDYDFHDIGYIIKYFKEEGFLK